MGGDIYSFSLSAGVSLDALGSISLTSDQVNTGALVLIALGGAAILVTALVVRRRSKKCS